MIQRFLNRKLTFALLLKLAFYYTLLIFSLVWCCSLASCKAYQPQRTVTRHLVADETEFIKAGEQIMIQTVNDQIFNELKQAFKVRYSVTGHTYRISFKTADTTKLNQFFKQLATR